MSRYVDGFVIPIKKENTENYAELARAAGEIWMEYGALEYYECLGDDLEVKDMYSFKDMAKTADDETVIFSFIVYESREQRDKINEAVMNDARIKEAIEKHSELFDYKRMGYGGFKSIVRLTKSND